MSNDAPDLGRPAPRGSVTLLHNYREHSQLSMKIYADELGDALGRDGWGVKRARPPDLLPLASRLPLASKIDSLLGRYIAYPRAARLLKSDIFHIVDHGQGHLVRYLDPARTVVTCHDIILLLVATGRLKSALRPPLATRLLRHAVTSMKRARSVIAVSQQTRSDLCSIGGLDPASVRVIAPGLDPAFRYIPHARDQLRTTLGLGSRPVVLHVGSANFYKNVPGVLRTTSLLRRNGVDAVLLRAGPRLPPRLRTQAAHLGVNIIDLGLVSREQLVRAYNAADVLLFPSLYEGFGWPPLEAMACGTPVVCSRGGSLAEVAAPAALTADAEDVGALAQHVVSLLTDDAARANLRRRGFAHALTFTWSNTARQVGSVYDELLA